MSESSELLRTQDIVLVKNDAGKFVCVKSRNSNPADVVVMVMDDGTIGIKGS
jgi:hypothetical protein